MFVFKQKILKYMNFKSITTILICSIVLNVVGGLHLKAIATLAKRAITMYLNSGEKEHFHLNENNKSIVPNLLLLEMKMKEHASTSVLPLVYSFLVRRRQKFFEKCGAKMYGLCQGDFGDK